jgi:PIN domain nuclease of toxin-antitoxin system
MSRYLLDSHILVWLRLEQKKVAGIAEFLASEDNDIFYSVVNPWELSIKEAKGQLRVPEKFFESFSTLGFACLPVEEEHIAALRTLPPLHHDPFDRMLVAQAAAEKMTLITSDKRLAAYPIKTLIA